MEEITAKLGFLSAHTEKPRFIIPESGQPSIRHGAYEEITVTLRDGRHERNKMGLTKSGFVLRNGRSKADFGREESIREVYYSEVEDIVKSETQAAHIFVIDHTIRSTAAGCSGRHAVTHVHNDYTPRSCVEHADGLAQRHGLGVGFRVVQLNLWRPLDEPVLSSPLALADGTSVRPDDLVPCEIVYPDRTGEIYEVRHHPDQRWYWFPRMMCSEVLLFKGHDTSTAPVVVRHVPHTSFHHPNTGPSTPARRSIEVRTIAFIACQGGSRCL